MEERKEKHSEAKLYIEKELYIRPDAAYKKIKAAQMIYQTVYIHGSSGCGKTSFIKNHLEKKRYLYFSAENLKTEDLQISNSGMHNIIVIDDLHLIGSGELHENLKKKIGHLEERNDVWLILCCRSRMPSWMTPVHYRRVFTVIEEADLALSEIELTQHFVMWGISPAKEYFRRIT